MRTEKIEGDNCKSITFEPVDLRKGEIEIVDYSKNTGHYSKGTIAEINGFNYLTVPIPETIKELLSFVS